MSVVEPKRILVATDFSQSSRAALDFANVLARRFGAALHLLHVAEPPTLVAAEAVAIAKEALDAELAAARRLLDDTLAELQRSGVGNVSGQVLVGSPADTIIELANSGQWDVAVLGTHGRRGLAHLLLGSVAESVVRGAHIPVVTVHPDASVGQPSAVHAG